MYDMFLRCRNKKGFTLMEMLIVVAIIAILIAIAIPIFSAQLDKARQEVDDANLRSATSMAVTAAMTDDVKTAATGYDSGTWTYTFTYSTTNKTLELGYGDTAVAGYNQVTPANTKCIRVTVTSNFVPTASWVAGA